MSKVKYKSYKSSKTLWLDKIPEHWQETDLRMLFADNKEKNIGLVEKNLLSLSYGKLKRKDIDNTTGLVPASFEGYQIIGEGYIVLRFTDLQNDKKSLRVGYANERGIITSAYIGLAPKIGLNSKYYYYLLHFLDKFKYYYNLGGGVRQSLSYKDFGRETILVPDEPEQTTIAKFLDYKTEKINRFIKKKKQLIKLLNEQKAAIINQAVTKGLDPNVPMKDSGIEWLGEIPEHWEVKKLKFATNLLRGKFTPRPRNDPKYYDGKYPFIQTGNLTSTSKYIETYNQTLNELGRDVSKEFPINTVVMSVAANIADVAILNFKACFPDSVIGFYPFKETDTDFLFYQLKNLRAEFYKIAIKSTQYNLNVDRVKNVKIFLPKLPEQKAIVSHIETETQTIDKTIDTIQKEITLVEEYKTALIAEAVTGKIDVRDFKLPKEETPLAMVAEGAAHYNK